MAMRTTQNCCYRNPHVKIVNRCIQLRRCEVRVNSDYEHTSHVTQSPELDSIHTEGTCAVIFSGCTPGTTRPGPCAICDHYVDCLVSYSGQHSRKITLLRKALHMKGNPKNRIRSRFNPTLYRDTQISVIMVARPLLEPHARKLCRCTMMYSQAERVLVLNSTLHRSRLLLFVKHLVSVSWQGNT